MKSVTNSILQYAPVVELADTPVLETGLASEGSSPFQPTKEKVVYSNVYDMTTLSTNEERRGLVLLGLQQVLVLETSAARLRVRGLFLPTIKL